MKLIVWMSQLCTLEPRNKGSEEKCEPLAENGTDVNEKKERERILRYRDLYRNPFFPVGCAMSVG